MAKDHRCCKKKKSKLLESTETYIVRGLELPLIVVMVS
jgi:hypothetical protein